MASLPVFGRDGSQVDTMEVDVDAIASRVNKQLLHDAVVMYQANLRRGTFRTKSRAEVAGSTKKMYRQKGTGNARAGSRRSGIRRGGGHIFAKRPRDFSYRLPKKALRLATRMAIASRLQDEEVVVLDDFAMQKPQTKEFSGVLKALGLQGQSVLVGLKGYDSTVYLSGRNIVGVEVAPVSEFNALSVLRPAKLLLTRAAVEQIAEKYQGDENAKAEEASDA